MSGLVQPYEFLDATNNGAMNHPFAKDLVEHSAGTANFTANWIEFTLRYKPDGHLDIDPVSGP